MTNESFKQVESIAECSFWSSLCILQYFWPALSKNLKTNFWSFLEWPFYTGFTVLLWPSLHYWICKPLVVYQFFTLFTISDYQTQHNRDFKCFPVLNIDLSIANSADFDKMPHFVASGLGLHCLLKSRHNLVNRFALTLPFTNIHAKLNPLCIII